MPTGRDAAASVVARTRADNTGLTRGMQEADRIVRQGAQQMQRTASTSGGNIGAQLGGALVGKLAGALTLTGLAVGAAKAVRAVSLDAHRKANDECRQGDTFDWERWDALALHHCMVDPEVTYDQALKLRRKAAGVAQDILDAIWRVSGLTERGEIKAKAVDDAEATFRDGHDQVQSP